MTAAGARDASEATDLGDEDVIAPVGDMGIPSPQRSGGSIFNAPVFIGGNLNATGSEPRDPVSWIDVTALTRDARTAFVEPPGYASFTGTLGTTDLIVLSGPDGGARTAAAVGLLESKHEPVLELQLGESTASLVRSVEAAFVRHQGAGVVIECAEAESMSRLTGFHLRALKGAAAQANAAIVLSTRASTEAIANRSDLIICAIEAPDAPALVRQVADAGETEARALAALPHLLAPHGPGRVRRLVDVVWGNLALTPEDAAAAVDGVSDALEEWFASRPVASDVSWLAAAVTLEGAPRSRVEELSRSLSEQLVATPLPDKGPRRFGQTQEGLPTGVLSTSRAKVRSRHGAHETSIVTLCPPYARERLIVELWERLGADYRAAYVEWLHRLADERPSVQQSAAVAAGVLFSHDPESAERLILRPWATSERASLRSSAAMALGVPALLDRNAGPARRLTRRWMSAADPHRQYTAIAAYGGPMGLWDLGCGGAWQLWQRVVKQDALQVAATRSLAGLVVGGEAAPASRAVVLELLVEASTDRRLAAHAFRVLPLLVRQLTGPSSWSRQSFTALQGPSEEASWRCLGLLLGRCVISPRGYADATASFGFLFEAVGQERLDVEIVRELIRQAKRELPGASHPPLGARLARVLNAERRGDSPRATAADAVHQTFFPTGRLDMGSHDFSPIADEGAAAPTPRLRDRLKGVEPAAPALNAGFVLVWFDAQGAVLSSPPTAGERRHATGHRWVSVDIRPQELDFGLDFKDSTGRVGFSANVGVTVRVRREGAAEVAHDGLTSVRAAVLPRVQRALVQARSALTLTDDDDRHDPETFERLRAQATDAFWAALDFQMKELPSWVAGEPSSVHVAFDASTDSHAAALITSEQVGRQADARATASLDSMDKVAGRLLPMLTDRHQRIFIKALMDPSSGNIDEAVALAGQADSATASQIMHVVNRLLEGDYIDKSDPLYASLEAVVDGSLQQLGRGGPTTLQSGSGQDSLSSGEGSHQTVEAEIIRESGDADFSGQAAHSEDR